MAEDGRFRAVNDYAVSHGYLSGFPNFHQADYGSGVVYGSFLIPQGSAEWRDVPRGTYGVYQIEDVPAMMRGAANYASAQGFRAAYPNFHQADHGAGVVYGTILFGASVDTRDVPRSQLGVYHIEDVPAMMRAANDYCVSQGYIGGFPNFHQADHGAGVVYGIVLLKPGSATHRDVRADLLALHPRPPEGMLLKEQTPPHVYVIRDGQRLHIPTPYALEALGHSWSAVRTVPDGELNHIPRDESWAPLGGRTPGSTVFVPIETGHLTNKGQVYWPINVATSKRHVAWGRPVRTVELRGWLMGIGGCNPVDPDWPYDLRLDSGWALSKGIDLNALIKVGTVLQMGAEPLTSNPRAWCATPRIHIELAGFPPKDQWNRKSPPDWTHVEPGCNLDNASAGAAHGQPVRWPFDPRRPPPHGVELAEGQYVRVYGSLVSDKPHPPDDDPAMKAGVELWFTGVGNAEDNKARWTEIHPPDWIEVRPDVPRTEELRGAVVAAPGTFTGRPRPESTLDVEIPAPPKPAGNQQLRVDEYVGPETEFASIMEGNASKTGAAITVLSDRVRVRVKVGGFKSIFGGSPGRFKALYRLYWQPLPLPPSGPTGTPPPNGPGPHRVTCVNKTPRLNPFASIRAIGGVNADGSRWLLSQPAVIAAIDAGTQFYVEDAASGTRVSLVVARGLFRRYVKTEADRIRANNLLELPEC